MQRRKLGRTDLEVSVITFGGMAFGSAGGERDQQRIRAIHAALDEGVNAIDTAPLYGFGEGERLVGRAIKDRRHQVTVMTKVGLRWDDPHGQVLFMTPEGNAVRKNSRPSSVRLEVEQSLTRLGIDVIDLVQVHHPDTTTPFADTFGTLLELRREGKLRAIGVSNFSTVQLAEAERALGGVPLASTQPEYSLLKRQIEREILPWAAAKHVGVLAYSSLGQGLLSGKLGASRTFESTDWRPMQPIFSADNRARISEVLERVVQPIAVQKGATIGQLALAWVIAQRGVTSAIVGARDETQACENARAGLLVLSDAELGAMRAGFEALVLKDLEPVRPSRIKSLIRRVVQW